MRFFIIMLLVYCFIFPSLANAQPRMITIGISRWGENGDYERNIQGFKDGLTESGFIEGENVRYLIGNPNGQFDVQIKIIENFIKDHVALIYTLTTPGTLAAKSVTKDIPIVFSIVTYPVETGIIDSLTSSRNNLVGTRNYITPAKQYYYFEKIYPSTKALAFVHRKGEPNSAIQLEEFRKYLNKRKVSLIDIAAIDADDIRRQLDLRRDEYDTLYLACDTLIQTVGAEASLKISAKYKIPTFSCNGEGVRKGSLIGTVADFYEIGAISGRKAALILNGTRPTNINTESAKQVSIMVNMHTVRALGLTVPEDILDREADLIDESAD